MTVTDSQPPKFLLSYHYFKTEDLDALVEQMPVKPMLFADSGAYSAFSQGAEINIKEYAAWLKRWQHLFSVYVNLDVIRDPKATSQNQAILERMGLQPIPVFHTGTEFKYLDRLMKKYPYIALGGMVGAERKATLRWAATCHKRAQDYGSVFHGFGQTSMDNVMSIPWYSVDSSSWAGGFMYGRIDLWDGRRWRYCQIGDHKSVMLVAPLIREHGFDPNIFADRSLYHRSYAVKIAAITWYRFEQFLRRRHGVIRLPERPSGTHVYLADTSKGINHRDAADGIHTYLVSGRSHPVLAAEGLNVYLVSGRAMFNERDAAQGLHLYLAQASRQDMMLESSALQQHRKDTEK